MDGHRGSIWRRQVTERKLYQGIGDCLWRTYRREGVAGLYKGYFISAAGIIPYFAITLAAYDEMKVGHLAYHITTEIYLFILDFEISIIYLLRLLFFYFYDAVLVAAWNLAIEFFIGYEYYRFLLSGIGWKFIPQSTPVDSSAHWWRCTTSHHYAGPSAGLEGISGVYMAPYIQDGHGGRGGDPGADRHLSDRHCSSQDANERRPGDMHKIRHVLVNTEFFSIVDII